MRSRPRQRKRRPTARKTKPRRSRSSDRRRGRTRKTSEVFIGLGSNLGDRRSHLAGALARIARVARISRVSSLYSTAPVGYASQPRFWNLVASLRWPGSPAALLGALKRVEREGGRRPTFRNGPRVIDCDILDFAGRVAKRPGLRLPHPRMAGRRFVLVPLSEIAPRWRHPVLDRTARELLAGLPKAPGVRRLASAPLPSARRRPSTSSGRRARRSGA